MLFALMLSGMAAVLALALPPSHRFCSQFVFRERAFGSSSLLGIFIEKSYPVRALAVLSDAGSAPVNLSGPGDIRRLMKGTVDISRGSVCLSFAKIGRRSLGLRLARAEASGFACSMGVWQASFWPRLLLIL